ncbi:glycoside hydrolase family 20 protein [Bacteroides sp. 51]|uniref:glycoside hydrolase family 20 protein n=1 Tax=Bacteroides sp. 51 TaxID=2302938 RepID=UPI0013D07C22|nr:glycoside hydrolase family 20 protein [Bacteroides sp. 51]NDV84090.1 beta-hexosaminidase [Bacteroides sp. 51]
MKQGIYLLLLCLMFISPGCQQTKEIVNEYQIIPQPNTLVAHEGRFKLTPKVQVITAQSTPEVKAIADAFIERIKQTSGITLTTTEEEHPQGPAIRFMTIDGMEKEAYDLSITPENITITASQPNGFFYAIQTLYQLLPVEVYGDQLKKRAEWSIPAADIADAPRFGYRGMHLDVCRHFSTVEYIYKYIDMLAMHKMNTFHFHLTDDQGWRIEIKKYPKLTEIGAKRKHTLVDYYYVNWPHVFDGKEYGPFYYTHEQIKDIVAYAAERYVNVIPEIEMPGHALAALASYPELGCEPASGYEVTGLWGIFPEIFCPKEETFQFMEGVIDEVIELFPSPYIHVGGDEAPKTAWKNCAHCQGLIRKLGLKDDTTPNPIDGIKHTKEEKLQSYFITRMEKYINGKGRQIIGWDEILEGGLAPNATVMSWRGVEGGMNAAKAGHDAIMTPNQYAYLDYYQEEPSTAPTTIGGHNTLKRTYSYNPVPDDADELIKKHIIGVQGNLWNEYIQTNERRDYQTFPRAIALAETGWTQNQNKNWQSFCERMVNAYERMELRDVHACRNFFEANINTHVDESNELKVVLESFYPNAEIRYTTDGSTPTAKSELYTAPFTWTGDINLQAAAFKDGKILGKVTSKRLYANLISGKPFTVNPRMGWTTGDIFGENDALGADKTTFGLTNGKRGDVASYTPWTSFRVSQNNNELEFTVNLEKPTQISKVVFGTLYNPAYRILPASAAIVQISADGQEFTTVAEESFTREFPERGRKAFTDEVSFNPVEATYVRLKLKSGGTIRNGIDCRKDTPEDIIPSDMYVDEVEIY